MTEVKIVRENELATIPSRGTRYSAGYDIYACIPEDACIRIDPNETVKVHTGIHMEIPEGNFGAIFARSGLATKHGLRPANCVGVIDSDYRGEIIVAIHNDSTEPFRIYNADRIAQMVIMPYVDVSFKEVDHLSDTSRGSGGFGSTGISK